MLFRASPAFLITLLVASICSTSAGRILSTVERQQTQTLNVNIYTGPDTKSDYLTTIPFHQNGEYPIDDDNCIDLPNGAKAVMAVTPNQDTGACFVFPNTTCMGVGQAFFKPADSSVSPLVIAPEGVYYGSISVSWFVDTPWRLSREI